MLPPRWVLLLLIAAPFYSFAQDPARLQVFEMPSTNLPPARTVRIYLPPSYATDTARRYPVLYLHDGQNVFSFAGTNIAFGWGSWQLDKTADNLSNKGRLQELILVGIDNSPSRMAEYSGRVQSGTNKPNAFENYAAFLIRELKPRIDREYRTKTGPADTGVMGSSMGGLASAVLAWTHPEVFGKAASLSGAFQVQSEFLNIQLKGYTNAPKPLRLYFDSGVTDFMGGDDGRVRTREVVEELQRIGYTDQLLYFVDEPPLTEEQLEKAGLRRDKWDEARKSQHNEFYWRLRSYRALEFLFPAVSLNPPPQGRSG